MASSMMELPAVQDYFRDPQRIQELILEHHGDLYQLTGRGWPSLNISGGELTLDSIVAAPMGVGFELDVTQFIPRSRWVTSSPSKESTR